MTRDKRVKTAWADLDYVRLVYDVEERRSRHCERLRGMAPDDEWTTGE